MKQLYDPQLFEYMVESGIDKYVVATYYLEDTVEGVDFLDHFSLIKTLIVEGSTGSWQEVKEETPEVRERLAGKLLGYYEVPGPKNVKRAVIQLGFPIEAWEPNVPMMLLSFSGNCFAYSKNLRLLDVFIPPELAKNFKGPKFGIEGIRELTGVYNRPLSVHIIKPKMGMTPQQTADQVYQTALGGVDLVKDDEMTSDTAYCRFDDRLDAVMEALAKAEKKTGKKVLYFISITDEVDKVQEKARRAVKNGANGLLLCYSAGLSTLRVLAEDPEINVPILVHPSHMLALLNRISFVALSKLIRLCGGDLTLSPTIWSSIPVASLEESLRCYQVLRAPFYHIKRTFPMPAAGMHPGLLPILIQEAGIDIIIPAGGGMLGHPMGYTAGAKAWQQAFEAVTKGIPLEEAAKQYPELKAALDKWGTIKRPVTPWTYIAPQYRPLSLQEGSTK